MVERELKDLCLSDKTVIFDMDGTLADVEHRRHFVDGSIGKKDFDAFYAAMYCDTKNQPICDLCNLMAPHYNIIICTGRPESYREITERWLEQNEVFYDYLMMRPDTKRHEADWLIKQDMLHIVIAAGLYVFMSIDDRDQVVRMWRRNGVTCLQVADGDF